MSIQQQGVKQLLIHEQLNHAVMRTLGRACCTPGNSASASCCEVYSAKRPSSKDKPMI